MAAELPGALDALRQRFLHRAADDLAILLTHQAGEGAGAEELKFTTHRLAGAAATFGFPAVSAAASEVEAALATGAATSAPLEALIVELRRLPRPES